jgi:hypothetical protein
MPYTCYVIELDPEVLISKRFCARNPDRRTDKPCVYVGMTSKTPEERFADHKRGYKCNRYAMRYGIKLRPRLYRNLQDFATSDEARAAEERLALRLRRRGYAVWWG